MANLQQKNSDTITGKENAQREEQRQLRHQLWVTQENCTYKELPLPSWAAQGSLVQKTQDVGFEEELDISPPQSQYQPSVNKPNTGTSKTSIRFPIARSQLLVFMALCYLWGFQGI